MEKRTQLRHENGYDGHVLDPIERLNRDVPREVVGVNDFIVSDGFYFCVVP